MTRSHETVVDGLVRNSRVTSDQMRVQSIGEPGRMRSSKRP